MRERDRLDKGIGGYRDMEQRLEDGLTLIELGEAEGDKETVGEAEKDLQVLLAEVQKPGVSGQHCRGGHVLRRILMRYVGLDVHKRVVDNRTETTAKSQAPLSMNLL